MKFKLFVALTASMLMLQSAYADVKFITYKADTTDLTFNADTGEIEKSSKPSALGKDSPLPTKIDPVSLSIPDTIEGKSVTATGINAFCDYDSMVSVTLPKTLKTLGDYSFAGCDSLKSITVPSGVTKISKGCFTLCDVLESVTTTSITEVDEKAFSYSKKLKNFDTSKVEKIGSGAFEFCESLESVNLTSLTQLDGSAFKDCKSLKTVTFGKDLKAISANAFYQTGLVSVTLGNNLTEIKQNAFKNCKSLESITIPSTVKKIDKTAFNGCDKLVIYCDKGSTAEAYAASNGIACRTDAKANSATTTAVTNTSGHILVSIDGQYLEMSQYPQNIDGSVFVPMRAIFEALGATIEWEQKTQTVNASKGADRISCSIGKTNAYLNGKIVNISAPKIINGSTMVPIRFVSESLGARVSWDGANQTVIITTK